MQEIGFTSLGFGTSSQVWFRSKVANSSSMDLFHSKLSYASSNVSGSVASSFFVIVALAYLGFGLLILVDRLGSYVLLCSPSNSLGCSYTPVHHGRCAMSSSKTSPFLKSIT